MKQFDYSSSRLTINVSRETFLGTGGRSLLKRLVCRLINFYDRNISPAIPACCRFYPTCSRYTYLAVEKYGLIRGLALGFIRVLKCAPWHPGGHDPLN